MRGKIDLVLYAACVDDDAKGIDCAANVTVGALTISMIICNFIIYVRLIRNSTKKSSLWYYSPIYFSLMLMLCILVILTLVIQFYYLNSLLYLAISLFYYMFFLAFYVMNYSAAILNKKRRRDLKILITCMTVILTTCICLNLYLIATQICLDDHSEEYWANLVCTVIFTCVLYKLTTNLITQKVQPLTVDDFKGLNIDIANTGKVSLYKSVNDGHLQDISRQIKGIMKVLTLTSTLFYIIMGVYNFQYKSFYECHEGVYHNKNENLGS